MYAPPAFVVESCANVDRNASPFAAVCCAFASSSSACLFLRAALSFLASSSSLLSENARPRLDLLRLDLGGGDLDLDNEREELLEIECDRDRLVVRLRLSAALASGEGDLDTSLLALEPLMGERSRDGIPGYYVRLAGLAQDNRVGDGACR